MFTIIEDTRNKIGKHNEKLAQIKSKGYNIIRSKLPIGDFSRIDKMTTVIDTKANINELINNVAGKQHDRFRNELNLAKTNGIKLIVLVENIDNVNELQDLKKWQNPRLNISKSATTGERLYKILETMQERYGVEFQFCHNSKTGLRIINILGGAYSAKP